MLADATRLVAPLALAHEQTLPVLPELEELLPGGSIRRGSIVGVEGTGATSLALALAAGPSAAGSWTAFVGLPSIGLKAAEEAGVILSRLLVVRPPTPSSWSNIVAALVGSVDVIMVAGGRRSGRGDLRRLTARLRERGSVMIRLGVGDGADVRLRVVGSEWNGLGDGHGLLQRRRVEVKADGRGASSRPRSGEMYLPNLDGAPGPAGLAPVTNLRGA